MKTNTFFLALLFAGTALAADGWHKLDDKALAINNRAVPNRATAFRTEQGKIRYLLPPEGLAAALWQQNVAAEKEAPFSPRLPERPLDQSVARDLLRELDPTWFERDVMETPDVCRAFRFYRRTTDGALLVARAMGEQKVTVFNRPVSVACAGDSVAVIADSENGLSTFYVLTEESVKTTVEAAGAPWKKVLADPQTGDFHVYSNQENSAPYVWNRKGSFVTNELPRPTGCEAFTFRRQGLNVVSIALGGGTPFAFLENARDVLCAQDTLLALSAHATQDRATLAFYRRQSLLWSREVDAKATLQAVAGPPLQLRVFTADGGTTDYALDGAWQPVALPGLPHCPRYRFELGEQTELRVYFDDKLLTRFSRFRHAACEGDRLAVLAGQAWPSERVTPSAPITNLDAAGLAADPARSKLFLFNRERLLAARLSPAGQSFTRVLPEGPGAFRVWVSTENGERERLDHSWLVNADGRYLAVGMGGLTFPAVGEAYASWLTTIAARQTIPPARPRLFLAKSPDWNAPEPFGRVAPPAKTENAWQAMQALFDAATPLPPLDGFTGRWPGTCVDAQDRKQQIAGELRLEKDGPEFLGRVRPSVGSIDDEPLDLSDWRVSWTALSAVSPYRNIPSDSSFLYFYRNVRESPIVKERLYRLRQLVSANDGNVLWISEAVWPLPKPSSPERGFPETKQFEPMQYCYFEMQPRRQHVQVEIKDKTVSSSQAHLWIYHPPTFRLSVDGRDVPATEEHFTSPPISDKENYFYDVGVHWRDASGGERTHTERVWVRAGVEYEIKFTLPRVLGGGER